MAEISQQVANIPLFADIAPEKREQFLSQCIVDEFEPGRVIVHEGSIVGQVMYVVLSGEIEIRKRDPRGVEILLETLYRGAFFGEMSLFEQEKRSATARVRTHARLLVITKSAFDRVMKTEPETASRMLRVFVRTLSHRLRLANERLAAMH